MVSVPSFEDELRRALNHLYDPPFLRRSAIIAALGLCRSPNMARSFRKVIRESIEALRPVPGTPATSHNSRYYQLLLYRYVQGLTQSEVAQQLNISPRQVRREQTIAIELLSESMCERFAPADRLELLDGDSAGLQRSREGENLVSHEMDWLTDSLPDRTTEVEPVLRRALGLARPLASKHSVRLDFKSHDRLPLAAVASTVLEQIVLNLITAAVRALGAGQVLLAARGDQGQLVIDVMAWSDTEGGGSRPKWDKAAVDVSRRLTQLFGGRLAVSAQSGRLTAAVVLPVARQVVVLAIEDNPHTLQLWERYLENTRFRLVGVEDPREALGRALELRPQLIILDVMMPGMDGWRLLGRLRNHPTTGAIPVVVCTVLPQKDLSLSLGASDFIRKPVTGGEFRMVLERQIAAEEHVEQI